MKKKNIILNMQSKNLKQFRVKSFKFFRNHKSKTFRKINRKIEKKIELGNLNFFPSKKM